jgi:hypothetical protein|tara:strand:+ start:214 stop:930 length:717 start_codon:yes stop_codon:yes gene_type:complete
MACKASPAVTPHKVILYPDGKMDVEAKISGLDMMPKYEELAQYVEVVCVVSPLAIDSNDVASITGWLNDGKNWWSEYDKWWYEIDSVESSLTPTIKRAKAEDHIEFYQIDVSEHFPPVVILKTPDGSAYESSGHPEYPDRFWNDIKNLTYMIYVQVDTQAIAGKYGITIADEYKGMMGMASVGYIYDNREENKDIAFNDYRLPDAESEDNTSDSCVATPDTSGVPSGNEIEGQTRGTP